MLPIFTLPETEIPGSGWEGGQGLQLLTFAHPVLHLDLIPCPQHSLKDLRKKKECACFLFDTESDLGVGEPFWPSRKPFSAFTVYGRETIVKNKISNQQYNTPKNAAEIPMLFPLYFFLLYLFHQLPWFPQQNDPRMCHDVASFEGVLGGGGK